MMLIEFSLGNYRSFKERVTFSLVAANITAKETDLHKNNVYQVDKKLKLLQSAAIYGANASGKSNLIKGFAFMKNLMLYSFKEIQDLEPIGVEAFRLSTESEGKASFFEIVFLLEGKIYRYGFEVSRKSVEKEWLFYVPKSREAKLFERQNGEIILGRSFKEGREVKKSTRDNALFLSVMAQHNREPAKKILRWLRTINFISGLDDNNYMLYTANRFQEESWREQIKRFVQGLDLAIEEVEIEKYSLQREELSAHFLSLLPEVDFKVESVNVKTKHAKFDAAGVVVALETFDMEEQESEGTAKLFALSGPLLETLKNGKILIIDELDARLHPLITRAIIALFHNLQTNPHHAQLIFVTHDNNLLSHKLFRPDQIWFTEKNRYGATTLYSLADYQIKNYTTFEKDYIRGRYGAIPFIGQLLEG